MGQLSSIDESMPRTEEELMKNNLTDSFVRAQVPIMEALLEFFVECDLMIGLSHFVSKLNRHKMTRLTNILNRKKTPQIPYGL